MIILSILMAVFSIVSAVGALGIAIIKLLTACARLGRKEH